MASCVSRGRLALFSDNKTKVSDGTAVVQIVNSRVLSSVESVLKFCVTCLFVANVGGLVT
jgi:hypothetical protein